MLASVATLRLSFGRAPGNLDVVFINCHLIIEIEFGTRAMLFRVLLCAAVSLISHLLMTVLRFDE